MKISSSTINILVGLITGNNKIALYRSGPNLIDFFSNFGCDEEYGSGFPSRHEFARAELKKINGSKKIKQAIELLVDPRQYINTEYNIESVVNLLNESLQYDGYVIKKDNKFYKVFSENNDLIKPDLENIDASSGEFIEEQKNKILEKISNSDFDGAITNSRSLVEAVFLYIIKKFKDEKYNFDGDLLKLFKQVQKQLNLDPEKVLDDSFKQILRGLTSIVNGIASISSKMGDRHARKYKPNKHHAELIANSSFTLVNFIIDTYQYQIENKIIEH